MRLCLNDCGVPLDKQTLPFVDPYSLADEPDEPLPVSLVSFKAAGNMHWLLSSLALPMKWWVNNHWRIPLLQEILSLIRDKKPKQGGHVLMPRNHKSLVPLQVREARSCGLRTTPVAWSSPSSRETRLSACSGSWRR